MSKKFSDKVYEITRQIPIGKVAAYSQIAELAGNPKAARAVGLLMKNNHDIPDTPCHRVVSSKGCLTGYSAGEGIKTKRKLLEREGVSFTKDKINMRKSKWFFPNSNKE